MAERHKRRSRIRSLNVAVFEPLANSEVPQLAAQRYTTLALCNDVSPKAEKRRH